MDSTERRNIEELINESGAYISYGTEAVKPQPKVAPKQQPDNRRNKKEAPLTRPYRSASYEKRVLALSAVVAATIAIVVIALANAVLIGLNVSNNAIKENIKTIREDIESINSRINGAVDMEEIDAYIVSEGLVKNPDIRSSGIPQK